MAAGRFCCRNRNSEQSQTVAGMLAESWRRPKADLRQLATNLLRAGETGIDSGSEPSYSPNIQRNALIVKENFEGREQLCWAAVGITPCGTGMPAGAAFPALGRASNAGDQSPGESRSTAPEGERAPKCALPAQGIDERQRLSMLRGLLVMAKLGRKHVAGTIAAGGGCPMQAPRRSPARPSNKCPASQISMPWGLCMAWGHRTTQNVHRSCLTLLREQ
jgi:hypothetical protein